MGNTIHPFRSDRPENQQNIAHKHRGCDQTNSLIEGDWIVSSTISICLWMYYEYGYEASCQHYGYSHWDVLWMLLSFKSCCRGIVHCVLYALHEYTAIEIFYEYMYAKFISYYVIVQYRILFLYKLLDPTKQKTIE